MLTKFSAGSIPLLIHSPVPPLLLVMLFQLLSSKFPISLNPWILMKRYIPLLPACLRYTSRKKKEFAHQVTTLSIRVPDSLPIDRYFATCFFLEKGGDGGDLFEVHILKTQLTRTSISSHSGLEKRIGTLNRKSLLISQRAYRGYSWLMDAMQRMGT